MSNEAYKCDRSHGRRACHLPSAALISIIPSTDENVGDVRILYDGNYMCGRHVMPKVPGTSGMARANARAHGIRLQIISHI